jgi:hypothetical protein
MFTSFEVLKAVQTVFVWVMTPCTLVRRYRRHGEHTVTSALKMETVFLRHLDTYPRVYTAP